jgi:hypothetical protein
MNGIEKTYPEILNSSTRPSLLGKLANAVFGIVTKAIEHPKALVPKASGGGCAEGWLNAWWHAVPQYMTDAKLSHFKPMPNL